MIHSSQAPFIGESPGRTVTNGRSIHPDLSAAEILYDCFQRIDLTLDMQVLLSHRQWLSATTLACSTSRDFVNGCRLHPVCRDSVSPKKLVTVTAKPCMTQFETNSIGRSIWTLWWTRQPNGSAVYSSWKTLKAAVLGSDQHNSLKTK